jgi:seryl-tRNA synthetase
MVGITVCNLKEKAHVIDLKVLRKDPEAFRKRLAGKRLGEDTLDRLVAVDQEFRGLLTTVEKLRQERNETSRSIKSASPEERPAVIEAAKKLKAELATGEERLKKVEPERTDLWLQIPNPPHPDVPTGSEDSDNQVVRTQGEKPEFSFPARDHLAIAEKFGWIDMERGAKVSGSRFAFLHDDLVELQFALVQFALFKLRCRQFRPTVTPVMVREEAMEGTGFFPAEKFEIYKIEGEDHYMVGTSEVPLAGLHMNEMLEEDRFPLRYAGISTCFRKEAGAAGKDTKGIFRVHQFDKIEMFSFCHPDRSWEEHEFLLAIEEEIMRDLELHYQIVDVCDGDLGSPAARKYDLEAWFPGQQKYRELTSCSNCTDFQARRLKARFKNEDDQVRLVHTLNGTAIAIGRTLIALLETHQQEDGCVRVPEALRRFLPSGKEFLGRQ